MSQVGPTPKHLGMRHVADGPASPALAGQCPLVLRKEVYWHSPGQCQTRRLAAAAPTAGAVSLGPAGGHLARCLTKGPSLEGP